MLKYPKQFKITPPEEAKGSFEKLAKIAERENRSMTKIIVEMVENYVRLHEPGNPQQRLDTMAKLGHAYHASMFGTCGFKDCHAKAVAKGMYLPTRKLYHLCDVHRVEVQGNRHNWRLS